MAIGPVPACWARSITRVSRSRARSAPSAAMTASIASSHSVVSTASMSGAAPSARPGRYEGLTAGAR